MFARFMNVIGILAGLFLMLACFSPWVHYNNINETFTGFHVTKFTTGNYYGRAGIVIFSMAAIILILMMVPRIWAKRANLFLSAILFAYCIRTYIIFTSALFEGEVDKRYGIYLIVLLSFFILVASVFPKLGNEKK